MSVSEFSRRTRFLNGLRRLLQNPLLESLVRRFVSGSLVGSLRSRVPPNYYQYPLPTSRRVVTKQGLELQVDIGTLLGWAAFFGVTDPALAGLYERVRPGTTVIDVGGNIGEVALRLGLGVTPGGHVHAFEPHPETHAELVANLALNSSVPVTAYNLGLGSTAGRMTLVREYDRNPGGQRLAPTLRGGASAQGIPVDITTLDRFAEQVGLARLDLIKIDVEGFEMEVLQGSLRTLERFRPALFIELDEANLGAQGTSVGAVLGLLEQLGYTVRHAETGDRLRPDNDFAGTHFDGFATGHGSVSLAERP